MTGTVVLRRRDGSRRRVGRSATRGKGQRSAMATRDQIREIGLGTVLVTGSVVVGSGSLAVGALSLPFTPFILWAVIRMFGRLP